MSNTVSQSRPSWERRTRRREDSFGQLVYWGRAGSEQAAHRAWTRNLSEGGMAMIVEYGQLPRIGEELTIRPRPRGHVTHYRVLWVSPMNRRTALVGCGVEEESSRGAAAKVVDPIQAPEAPSVEQSGYPDDAPGRDDMPTPGRERRCSDRWLCNKAIRWRVAGGRKGYEGYVIERSLHGMVIESAAKLRESTRILPFDDRMGEHHGFRTAVVRRTTSPGGGGESGERRWLLCVEILA